MPKILNFTKDERAAKEQAAFQQIQKTKGYTPTQEEVYTQAYGSAYPVFQTDFELPRIQNELKDINTKLLTAPDDYLNELVRPKHEKRYTNNIRKVLKGTENPYTKRALMGSILGKRQSSLEDTAANQAQALANTGQLKQMELDQANRDFQLSYDQTAGEEQAYNQAQAEQAAFQRDLALLQFKNALSGGGGGGGYGRAPKAAATLPIGATEIAQSILDGTFDPADLSYELQGPVYAEIARIQAEMAINVAPDSAAGTEQTSAPLFDPLQYIKPADFSGMTAQNLGQGAQTVAKGAWNGLGQGISSVANDVGGFFKGLFGK